MTNHQSDSNSRENQPSQPFSELQILRLLYRCKWAIFGFALLAGIVTAAYTLTLPNVYEANSALIIREPQVPITGEAAPLTIGMLKSLTESTEVKFALFEKLKQDKVIGRSESFSHFQKSIQANIAERRGTMGAVEQLPMLVLGAQASSPAEAKAVANAWADQVVERNKSIYTKGVEELNFFIGNVYDEATTKLDGNEEALTSKTLSANLESKQELRDINKKGIASIESELLDLRASIAEGESRSAELAKRLAGQEKDGMWVGDAVQDAAWLGTDGSLDLSHLDSEGTVIAQLARRKVAFEKDLTDFRATSALDDKKRTQNGLDARLSAVAASLVSTRTKLNRMVEDQKLLAVSISERESDGRWVGEVLDEYYRERYAKALTPPAAGGTRTVTSIATDGPAAVLKNPSEVALKVDRLIRESVGREIDLLGYQLDSDISLKQARLSLLQADLTSQTIPAKQRAAMDVLAGEREVAALKPQLEQSPQKIVVGKAITDDALWSATMRGETDRKLPETSLKSEEINLVHQDLLQRMLASSAKIETSRRAIVDLGKHEDELRPAVEALRIEVAQITMEIDSRSAAIDRVKDLLDVLGRQYKADKMRYLQLGVDIRQLNEDLQCLEDEKSLVTDKYNTLHGAIQEIESRLAILSGRSVRANASLVLYRENYDKEKTELQQLTMKQGRLIIERDRKETSLEHLSTAYKAIEKEIATDNREITRLQREIDKYRGTQSTLAAKVGEMALLKISAQQASRSGTTVLFRAQENPSKVAPVRSKTVLLSMVASFLIACLGVILRRLIQDTNGD